MSDVLRNLTVLVTGATGGIGRATAEALARAGASVIVHGRDRERVDQVVAALRARGGRADGVVADLASLEATARLAQDVADRAPLDVLINNAGVGFGPPGGGREVSIDGYELRFAVNYLAPFLLTHELLARDLPRRAVINVASAGQFPIDFNDLMLERRYSGVNAYRRSKLALIMFTFDVAEQFPRVACNALHPGTFLDTKMVRESGVRPQGGVSTGSESVIGVLERTLTHGISGQYFDETRPARALSQAYDAQAHRRLRELSLELTAPFRSHAVPTRVEHRA